MRIAALVLYAPLLSSCLMPTDDVTDDEKWSQGYRTDRELVLKQEVFLVRYPSGGYELFAPEDLLERGPAGEYPITGKVPRTIAEYRSDPTAWPSIVEIISRGVRIRFDEMLQKHRMTHTQQPVTGRIQTGERTGLEVRLNGVSTPNSGLGPRVVNPNSKVFE